MAESGDLDFRSCSQIWIFSNTFFLRVFEKLEPDKWGTFSKHIFLAFFFFEKWDPDIFQKSQIFKISFFKPFKNAHIKLNGFQSIFGGWGDMPFIFFMGWMLRFGRNLGFRTTHPSCLSTLGGAIGRIENDGSIFMFGNPLLETSLRRPSL